MASWSLCHQPTGLHSGPPSEILTRYRDDDINAFVDIYTIEGPHGRHVGRSIGRSNGLPAKIIQFDHGYTVHFYYLNGRPGRVGDFPTQIEYNSHGIKVREKYTAPDGELHRLNGPAQIDYDDNGEKERELFCLNGAIRRGGDKPSQIQYLLNGKYIETYIRNKDRCPARYPSLTQIHYDRKGRPILFDYSWNGCSAWDL